MIEEAQKEHGNDKEFVQLLKDGNVNFVLTYYCYFREELARGNHTDTVKFMFVEDPSKSELVASVII